MIRKEITLDAPLEDVWDALTDAERLADWFANDVELDLREGGDACFRWSNGEERRAVVTTVEPEERLVLAWEDDGEVSFTLADAGTDGTILTVEETSPAWSTALELQACMLVHA